MKHLSLEALRSFSAVIELGSMTLAGERMGRSQPAISLQLKKLEQQLGVELLTRQGSGFALTADGDVLFDYAQRMLALNDQAWAQFEPQQVSGKVRLGITSEFASSLLPKVLGQFAQVYPQVTLQVTSALSKDLLSGLGQQFDIILALREQTNKSDVLIQREELVWVGSPALVEQASLPLVVAPEGCIYRRRAEQSLQRIHQPYRITYTNTDFSGLTAALHSSLGITVLARSTVPDSVSVIDALANGKKLPAPGSVNVIMRLAGGASSAASQLADYLKARI
ncbi:LysR family transcriptional regulator [Idiomarina sp. M1R2S28]|jgi:DNA-binding transcriptional LysR family regulator|uniref:LysR family transcriptional regulator n=1 Tax=Idiomarina rhizosphaerae TaxID=2961572 RepID=A0A9X2FXH2_9GAMM|nr:MULTISPECIES: LysR family transcriptional regulator [Idiomarina]MCP1339279.1 LysR family transcriptional regulator [Idiomarina rhizosphaerae]NWO03450.1 LysR family transcriptional regulator [Idiomarinaceae bacterium]